MKSIIEWRFQGWNRSFLIYKDEHTKKYGIKSRLGHDIMPCLFADINWFAYKTSPGPDPQISELAIFEMNNKQAMYRYSKLMEKVPGSDKLLLEFCSKYEVSIKDCLPKDCTIIHSAPLRKYTSLKDNDIIIIQKDYRWLYQKKSFVLNRRKSQRSSAYFPHKDEMPDEYVPLVNALLNRGGEQTYILISPYEFCQSYALVNDQGEFTYEDIRPTGTVIDAFYKSRLNSWEEFFEILINRPFEVTFKRIKYYDHLCSGVRLGRIPEFNFIL